MRPATSLITRVSPALPKVLPSLPDAVPPALRFMLEREARADGDRFYRDLDGFTWNMPDPGRWAEEFVIGAMARRWPAVARADEAVGGLLSDALRVVAANPRTFPRWWLSVAVVLSNGHPERLRGCCERILAHAGVAFARHVIYDEEQADRPMREAARHWQDRDLTDDLAGDED